MSELADMYKRVLQNALQELENAVKQLLEPTFPDTDLPTPKFFEIGPGITWPYKAENGNISFRTACHKNYHRYHLSDWAGVIVNLCKAQPRCVYKSLQEIRKATEWCKKRTEGRKRHAEEILRQQSKWLEALRAEDTLQKLEGE